MPEELKAEADALLGRIAAGNEALRAAALADDEKAAARLAREQAGHARQWADLQAQMLAAQGGDEQLNPPRITLAETQARLGAWASGAAPAGAAPLAHVPRGAQSGGEGALLLFQLGEDASYLLVITAETAEAHRLPPRREIELLALPVIFDCSFGDANAAGRFARNNAALSRALLGAVGAERLRGKRVLVAADGVLCYLPFEALFPEPDAAAALTPASYADLKGRYLLDVADVSYAPSASAWRELSDRAKREPASSLFAVYDVSYDTGDPPLWSFPILMKLDSVPGASDVRKAIAFAQQAWPELPVEQLRARRDDNSPEDAARQPTEENFLRVAPLAAARFVVFNGHATYNDKHPNLSGLVFNLSRPNEPDAAEIPADNFLRVDELFRLELPAAEVTFLAACQTALGAPYRGEGLNALLRAFMYRGSPAVVATLWAVDANAASWLVRRFFKLLAENPGEDPARLFNQAKRASIGFDNRWLPYQWAPFIWAGS